MAEDIAFAVEADVAAARVGTGVAAGMGAVAFSAGAAVEGRYDRRGGNHPENKAPV